MSELFRKMMGWVPQDKADGGDSGGGGDGDTKSVDRGDTLDELMGEEEEGTDEGGDDKGDDEGDADEGSEEGEGGKEEKATGSKKEARSEPMIPKARLDEVLRKARAREQELQEQIDGKRNVAKADDNEAQFRAVEAHIDALETELETALENGKSKEVTRITRDIRLNERWLRDNTAARQSLAASSMAAEKVKTDILITELEAEYDELNPDHADYDAEAVEYILDAKAGKEAKGIPSSRALADAVEGWMRKRNKQDKEDTAKAKGLGAKKEEADRKAAAVARNLAAAKKAGKDLDLAGQDSSARGGGGTPKDATAYSDEEFASIPASTRARLRGDFVDA